MTASQATHLIEQFASQCPLAIWILDQRGVAIFANKKIYEMFEIQDSTSSAVGINLLKLSSIEKLNLTESRDKFQNGESVTTSIYLENPKELGEDLKIGRTEPLSIRVVAYALKSSKQTIEHFVIFLEDVTSSKVHQETIQEQTRDIQTFLRSKKTRGDKLETLQERAKELQKQITELGYEPESQ